MRTDSACDFVPPSCAPSFLHSDVSCPVAFGALPVIAVSVTVKTFVRVAVAALKPMSLIVFAVSSENARPNATRMKMSSGEMHCDVL